MEYSKCVMKNRLILVISSGCHRNNAIQIIWIASSKSILNYSVIFVKSFYDIFHCEIYSSKYSTISIFDKITFLIYRKERNLLPLSGTKVVGEIVGETRQILLEWKSKFYILIYGDADKILDQLRVRRFICILTKTASVL